MSPTILIVGFIVLLIGAHFLDEWKWRVKTREQLVGMVLADDWRLRPKALLELRRRGEDLQFYLPSLLPRLGAEDRTARVAAEMLIRKHYPEIKSLMEGYSPIATVEACREKIRPLLERYDSEQ